MLYMWQRQRFDVCGEISPGTTVGLPTYQQTANQQTPSGRHYRAICVLNCSAIRCVWLCSGESDELAAPAGAAGTGRHYRQ